MKKNLKCPTCNKLTSMESSNKFRPFCSERCRLIDLGEWMEQGYTIPDQSHDALITNDTETDDLKIKH